LISGAVYQIIKGKGFSNISGKLGWKFFGRLFCFRIATQGKGKA
jgi:hypothetical protein